MRILVPQADIVTPELMEKLAALEHDRWSSQAKTALNDMTPERRERWEKLANLPYEELSEEMKEKDREQVRLYLALIMNNGGVR